MRSSWRRGFNLVEAAIVLGIVGLVIGGIWVAASSIASNMKSNDAQLMFNSIVNSVYTMYGGMPTPSTNTSLDAALAAAKSVPETFINAAGNDIVNPWGGNVNVNIIANSPPVYLRVWMYSVPYGKACIDLVSRIFKTYSSVRNGEASGPTLMYLAVSTNSIMDAPGYGFEQLLNTITARCTGSGSIDISVRFNFP